jgi:hypothetical protein
MDGLNASCRLRPALELWVFQLGLSCHQIPLGYAYYFGIRAIRNEWAMMIGSLFGLAAVYKFPFLIHGRFR